MQQLALDLLLLYNVASQLERVTLEEALCEKKLYLMYVQTSQKSPTRIPSNVLSTRIQLEHICSETKTSQACFVLLMCIYSRCTVKDFLVNLFSLWFCPF